MITVILVFRMMIVTFLFSKPWVLYNPGAAADSYSLTIVSSTTDLKQPPCLTMDKTSRMAELFTTARLDAKRTVLALGCSAYTAHSDGKVYLFDFH